MLGMTEEARSVDEPVVRNAFRWGQAAIPIASGRNPSTIIKIVVVAMCFPHSLRDKVFFLIVLCEMMENSPYFIQDKFKCLSEELTKEKSFDINNSGFAVV